MVEKAQCFFRVNYIKLKKSSSCDNTRSNKKQKWIPIDPNGDSRPSSRRTFQRYVSETRKLVRRKSTWRSRKRKTNYKQRDDYTIQAEIAKHANRNDIGLQAVQSLAKLKMPFSTDESNLFWDAAKEKVDTIRKIFLIFSAGVGELGDSHEKAVYEMMKIKNEGELTEVCDEQLSIVEDQIRRIEAEEETSPTSTSSCCTSDPTCFVISCV